MTSREVIVIDTETTGLDPNDGATVIEVAGYGVDANAGLGTTLCYSSLIAYEGEIPPTAKAVHHITERDVHPSRAPSRAKALAPILTALGEDAIPAAHNAAFDSKFLPEIEGDWICTWRCAMHLWPQAPSHSNQVLRYWLGVDSDDFFWLPSDAGAHRALYDAAVTAAIVSRMLRERSVEELLLLSTLPVLLETVRFGKYEGWAWKDVPFGYLSWYLKTEDQDPDVAHTCRHWVKNH